MRAIVNAILDNSHTLEQQVYVLRHAVKQRQMKVVGASAGLFAGSGKDVDEQILKSICDTI